MAVRKINIDDSEISVIFGLHDEDYICLTDMVNLSWCMGELAQPRF